MSSSSFEIVHHDDDTYTTSKIPRDEDKHLKAPVLPHNLLDIWNDTDDEDKTTIRAGNNLNTNIQVKVDVHDNIQKAAKASIEADTESSDEEIDDYLTEVQRHRVILRELAQKCEHVDILIATKGWRSSKDAIHDIIPTIYSYKVNVANFPHLAEYLRCAIGPLPHQEFLINQLNKIFRICNQYRNQYIKLSRHFLLVLIIQIACNSDISIFLIEFQVPM